MLCIFHCEQYLIAFQLNPDYEFIIVVIVSLLIMPNAMNVALKYLYYFHSKTVS